MPTSTEWIVIGISAVGAVTGVVSLVAALGGRADARKAADAAARSADAAERSAGAASRALEERRRARMDQLGPVIILESVTSRRERWMSARYGQQDHPPGLVAPETDFNSPGDDDVQLLVGAHVMFRNEGTRTAHVSVTAYRVDRADSVEGLELILAPPGDTPNPIIPDGVLTVEPQRSAGVVARTGPTLGKWIASREQAWAVKIVASADRDGARQEWVVWIATPLLSLLPHNASAYRITPQYLPTITIEELPRTYPEFES